MGPTQTAVNDSTWLTHEAIRDALRAEPTLATAATLRSFAQEADRVGAVNLADDLSRAAAWREDDAQMIDFYAQPDQTPERPLRLAGREVAEYLREVAREALRAWNEDRPSNGGPCYLDRMGDAVDLAFATVESPDCIDARWSESDAERAIVLDLIDVMQLDQRAAQLAAMIRQIRVRGSWIAGEGAALISGRIGQTAEQRRICGDLVQRHAWDLSDLAREVAQILNIEY